MATWTLKECTLCHAVVAMRPQHGICWRCRSAPAPLPAGKKAVQP